MTRLETLLFTRRVVEEQARRQLAQIDQWITAEQQREAERQRAAAARPPAAEWLVERALDKRDATYVHTGECWAAEKSSRCRPLTREQALQALTDGVAPCPTCRPDTELGLLD